MKNRIRVSSSTYILCWWSVLFVHLICAIFILALGAFHEYTALPDQYMYSASSLQIPHIYFIVAGRSFMAVTCLHCVAIGRMVYHSIEQKQLIFHGIRTTKPHTNRTNTSASLTTKTVRTVLLPLRAVRRLWSEYFGIDGLFGLNGPYFDTAFRLREVIEAFSQAYQAYILSNLMTTQWVNQLAVGIIAVGCLSAPIIHFVWRHNNTKRRFVSLLVDTLLDLSSSVAIPAVILYEMGSKYDWERRMFPIQLTYDNVWLYNEVAQARLIYVWSMLDYVTTLILQLSVVGCMLTLASGLERNLPRERRVHAFVGGPKTASLAPDPVALAAQPSFRTIFQRRRWRRMFVDGLFTCWGLVVLYAHVRANQVNTEDLIPSCMLGVNAWFSTKPGCAVLWINCHTLGISGRVEETTPILDQMERSTLGTFAVMHCPAFTMPDIIQEFHHLRAIELTNVTLVSWPLSAAAHDLFHPELGHIALLYVNLTEIPPGILHPDLPLVLNDLDISQTNVTVLPESIGEYWSNRLWLRLNFDYIALSELPAAFAQVPNRRLSLIGNHLNSIPDEILAHQELAELYVSGNSLQNLPSNMGDVSNLRRVYAEHTMLKTLPIWWHDWYDQDGPSTLDVRLYGTPLCDDPANTELTATMRKQMCAIDTGTINGTNEWDIVWQLRPVTGVPDQK